jgi:hypothetical protein
MVVRDGDIGKGSVRIISNNDRSTSIAGVATADRAIFQL